MGMARSVPGVVPAIAIYIRLQVQKTPIFEDIKAKGQKRRLRADLPDRGSCGMLPARPIPDAGDP